MIKKIILPIIIFSIFSGASAFAVVQPDLMPTTLYVYSLDGSNNKTSPTIGKNLYVDVAWKNQGTADAGGFISKLLVGDVSYLNWNTSSLNQGQTESWPSQFLIGNAKEQIYTIKLVVNSEQSIIESDKNNNTKSVTFTPIPLYVAPATQLPAPTGLLPADNAKDVSINVILKWDSVTGADHYSWTIGGGASGEATTNQSSPLNLNNNTKYDWTVAACPTTGTCSANKASASFTTVASATPAPSTGGTVVTTTGPIGAGNGEGAPLLVSSAQDLIDKINKIGNWIFIVLMALASVFMIYAGFLWVTAGGNPEGATKARQMLINAVIGVTVALLAKGLVRVMRSIIGG